MKKIALLPEGSVSHEAILYLVGEEPVQLFYYKQISDVFLSTVNGITDFSVVPTENTIEGSVSLHMDWLVNEVDLPIRVEWVYPSIQNVIGRSDEFITETGLTDLSKVTKVLSHPVAIAQCQQFIRNYLPSAELESVGSTAEAIEIVNKTPGQGWVAIGTRLGSQKHGLDILAEKVTDHDNNYTRFILIGPEEIRGLHKSITPQQKTSLVVTLNMDYSGALHQVLSAFAWRKLSLSRIESRPTKKQLGNYYFYIDVMESADSVLLNSAIGEIEALDCGVRILGSYPSYTYVEHKPEVES